MLDVAILGAGELGGSIAHVLARTDTARSIRLIDSTAHVAAGKALDIMQASPVEQFATRVSGTTDISHVASCSVAIVADRAIGGSAGEEWHGDDGFLLLKQLTELARHCVVVCAGASQRELVERAVRELRYSPRRVVGSAPEALAGAVRAVVALETNGSAADVALTVLGVPPAHIVVAWEDATIGGFAATRVLDEPARRRIAARVSPLWPPGPYALATAAAAVVAAIDGRSRRTLSCFTQPSGGHERVARAAALPVRLDLNGIAKIEMPPLSGSVRVAFENATGL